MPVNPCASQYAYIAGAATTQVKNGRGRLRGITFGTPVASATVTIYDEITSGTTRILALITNTTDVKPYALPFDVPFDTGLKIVTSGADKITVAYD